jgi:hypothetical protein
MMRKWISAALAAIVLFGAIGAARASDCSGTITAGNTAQTVFTSGNVRKLMLMNNSANLMCMSINGSAATIAGTNCGSGSYTLQPGSATTAGGSFYADGNGPAISTLSVISSGTGDRYSCERQ